MSVAITTGGSVSTEKPSLYQALRSAGVPLSNHESDLYVKDTPAARGILHAYEMSYTTFTNQIDGTPWFDVPFMYEPWWEMKGRKVTP